MLLAANFEEVKKCCKKKWVANIMENHESERSPLELKDKIWNRVVTVAVLFLFLSFNTIDIATM